MSAGGRGLERGVEADAIVARCRAGARSRTRSAKPRALAARARDDAATAAPDEITGGGAAAAHAASLAAALGEMVAHLVERKGSRRTWSARRATRCRRSATCARGSTTRRRGRREFRGRLGARRMPRRTEEERRARANAVEEALKGAAAVPLEVASLAVQVCELLETLAELGEPAWLSDSAVGAQLALAAVVSARYNVLVNASEIEDEEFHGEHLARADDLLERAREIAARVRGVADGINRK
jgi:formiminotetrahydrofolate cyclodeaminase